MKLKKLILKIWWVVGGIFSNRNIQKLYYNFTQLTELCPVTTLLGFATRKFIENSLSFVALLFVSKKNLGIPPNSTDIFFQLSTKLKNFS